MPHDRKELRELAREALARLPDGIRIKDELGTLLAAKGETAEAAELLRAALRQQPENAGLHYHLARVLDDVEPAQARDAAMPLAGSSRTATSSIPI